jgi:enoyl-CoA hydratase/carnithine racemase
MSAGEGMRHWRVERHEDGVVVAGYRNDPMNYFFADGAAEFAELVGTWAEPAVRAVVLTGDVPGKFITHYSVEELVAIAEDREALPTVVPELLAGYGVLLEQMRALPKPVIVAMTGDTMGGGLELSLGCDIRIAQRGDFSIGFPEVSLGILAGGGGTQRLARTIGTGPALDFLLRSRIVSPEQALALGIVSEVADDALARALEVAAGLARQSATSLAQTKRSVLRGAQLPLAEGLRVEAEAFLATMLTPEAVTAMGDYVGTPLDERRGWVRSRATGVPGDPA